MKKYVLYASVLSMMLCVFGCKANSVNTETPGTPNSVIDYEYTENSRAVVSFSNDEDTVIDVSDYVVNYSSGEILITDKGLEAVFGLKKVEATEKDIQLIANMEAENNYASAGGTVVRFENEEHYFLFKTGSTIYIYDGAAKNLINAVIENESGEVSYPMFDVVFCLGYESIGTSVKENVLTYMIYEPVEGESSPNAIATDSNAISEETESDVINEETVLPDDLENAEDPAETDMIENKMIEN